MSCEDDVIKTREIRFTRYGVNQSNDQGHIDQAGKALSSLAEVDGIEAMSVAGVNVLQISYDVRQLTLQMLESALREAGFNLDLSITCQIKRSLFAYCEEAQRSSLGIEQAQKDSRSIAIPEIGAHDPRPDNWRHYV